ncbi:MAG TPA: hypothetical protein VFD71_21575 [Planctomycetota bacterium]|nr:hypothetical protein [Planctomycetota bacterium]
MRRFLGFGLGLLAGCVITASLRWSSPSAAAVEAGGGGGVEPLSNGDVNGDHKIDLTDAIYLLTYLFQSGAAPAPIECEAPSEDKAYFRFLNVLVCGDQRFAATLGFCGQNVNDTDDDANTPTDCTPVAVAANCAVRASATTVQCGSFALRGDLAPVKDHVYDFVMTVDDGGNLLLLFYDQMLDGQGACPVFPAADVPATGAFVADCPAGAAVQAGAGVPFRNAHR